MERVKDLGDLIDTDVYHSLLDHVRRPKIQHVSPEVTQFEGAVEAFLGTEVDVFGGSVGGDRAADRFSNTWDEEAVEIAVALQPYSADEEEAMCVS
jgi:hypothetical protein